MISRLPRRALLVAALLVAPAAALVAAAPAARAEHDVCAPSVLNAYACVRTRNTTWGAGSCEAGAPEYYAERHAEAVASWGEFYAEADVLSYCYDARPGGAERWRDYLSAWVFVIVPDRAARASFEWIDSGSTDPARPYHFCFARASVPRAPNLDVACPDGRPPPLLPALP